MKKYVLTKSMTTAERMNIAVEIKEEFLISPKFLAIYKDSLKAMKGRTYVIKSTEFYGLKIILLFYKFTKKENAYDIIINTTPAESHTVEYTRITPTNTPVIYTQHFLDRYNQRQHNYAYGSYDKLIKAFNAYNPTKPDYAISDDNQVVGRMKQGFIFGELIDNYIVIKTFYDDSEKYDNEDMKLARERREDRLNKTPEERAENIDLMRYAALSQMQNKTYLNRYFNL